MCGKMSMSVSSYLSSQLFFLNVQGVHIIHRYWSTEDFGTKLILEPQLISLH